MRPTPPAVNDRSALLVVDIQRGGAAPPEKSGIGVMDGYRQMAATAERIVSAARAAVVPVIFIQELHRPSGVDFGRELDGEEGIHCVEGASGTELAALDAMEYLQFGARRTTEEIVTALGARALTPTGIGGIS